MFQDLALTVRACQPQTIAVRTHAPSLELRGSTLSGSHALTSPLSPLCEAVWRPRVCPAVALHAGSQSLLVRCPPGAGHSTSERGEAWNQGLESLFTQNPAPPPSAPSSGLGGAGVGVGGLPQKTLKSPALQQSPQPLETGLDARGPGGS